LTRHAEIVEPKPAEGISCRDLEDVKFIDCLLGSTARCLVTGDKDLLDVKMKRALILTPRQFCDRYL